MLNINPEIVCAIIQKAREFHAKEDVVITETPDSYSDDWARQWRQHFSFGGLRRALGSREGVNGDGVARLTHTLRVLTSPPYEGGD